MSTRQPASTVYLLESYSILSTCVLELLGRAVLPLEGPLRDSGEQTGCWPVFAAERQAMEQADTPFFTARASSDALIVAPGQEIEACFEEPSFDLVVTRLKSLNDEDMERQVALIQGSLYAHIARNIAEMPGVNSTGMVAGSNTNRGGKISSERLVSRALAEETGEFALHPLLPKSVYCPGFFQGTAAIGYELLRIAHPDALPCVLLWE